MFVVSSVNEDYEYKFGLCKKPSTIVECQYIVLGVSHKPILHS